MNAGAYPAVSANTIVLWGRWFAHRSRQGRQSTIQAIPLRAAGQLGSGYPNLVDDIDEAEIKTEPWETTPLIDGALWALPLLPTADQQLGAFGGYELRRGDEPALIVELLESTGTIPATQEMLDALTQACVQSEATQLDFQVGDPIQAVWIGHVANLSTPAPQPPDGFLTTAQTTSLIARYTWRPRGTWSSTTAYEQRDVVKYLGAMWVADAPSTGVTPGTGSTWRSVVDKGDPGATGTPGSPGAPGNPGPANSLAIGTVTTGAAGSSASAQITGTPPSQTLSLTVPRGDKGDGSVSSVDGNSGPNVTLASDGAAGTATKRSLGTGATQAAAGNDSRITGAAQKAQNLADLPDKAVSRASLGLGNAATYAAADLPVSTATQTALNGKASTADVTSASTADRARPNHTGQQTSATISDFTEAVQDAVAALLGAGSNITLYYDDAANALTVSAAGGSGGGLDAEAVRDAIGVALVGVAPVSVVVNDAADTITISSAATQNSTDAQLRDRSTHTGPLEAGVITGVLDDARIPAAIARDSEVAGAVATREPAVLVPAAGAADNAAVIAAADAAATAGAPLVLQRGVHRVASNLTIASPVTIHAGAIITPDAGVTVTLAGGVLGPRGQIFDHSAGGLVVPRRVDYYHPAWWGPVNTADDTVTWSAMVAALNGSKVSYNGTQFGQRVLAPSGINRFFGISLAHCQLIAHHGTSVFQPAGNPSSGSMLTLGDYCTVTGGYWRTTSPITLLDSQGFRNRIEGVYVVPNAAGATGISLGFGGTGTSTTPVLRDVQVHSGAPASAPVGTGIYLNSPDSEFVNVWVARCNVGIQYERGNGTHTNIHIWGCNTGLAGSPDEMKLANIYIETNRGWGIDFGAADRNMITNGHIWANGFDITGTGGMRLLKSSGVSSKDNILTALVFDDNVGVGLLIDGPQGTEVQSVRFASRIVQSGNPPVCDTGCRVTAAATGTRLTIRGRRSDVLTTVLDDQSGSSAVDVGSYKRTLAADVALVSSTGLGPILSLPVEAGERWLLDGVLIVDGPQAGDIKIRLQATGATGVIGTFGLIGAVAASTTSATATSTAAANTAAVAASGGNSTVTGLVGVGVPQTFAMGGHLVTATAGGTIDLQVGQQTADAAATTVRAGSWLRATRVA